MKRNKWMVWCAAAVMMGLGGCDWETGSDAESWSSSYDWVNFAGTYRAASGRYLVTDYTTISPATEGYTEEDAGSASGSGTTASSAGGVLGKPNIVPGSVGIRLYSENGNLHSVYTDNGANVLEGTLGTDGTIAYEGGSWNIDFSAGLNGPANGTWEATFEYYVYIDGEPSTGGGSGATGAIYTFVVSHQGQNLSFTDNNGATYSGRFGKISSSSGAQNTDIGQVGADEEANDGSKYTYYESPLPEDGDTIVANFEVAGTSRAGMSVKIVGTFQGTVATGIFTGRTLRGTWIESGGKTGDVYGQTTFIPVATSDGTDTGAETETATEETAAE